MAANRNCGMACCQKQLPLRDNSDLPKSGEENQNQAPVKFVSTTGLLSGDAERGSAADSFYAEFEFRLASPTLESQHISLQI